MTVKSFKWLNKLIEKGAATEGDAYHVERSEAHLTCQIGVYVARLASSVRAIAALKVRNPSPVGPLISARKMEHRCDHI